MRCGTPTAPSCLARLPFRGKRASGIVALFAGFLLALGVPACSAQRGAAGHGFGGGHASFGGGGFRSGGFSSRGFSSPSFGSMQRGSSMGYRRPGYGFGGPQRNGWGGRDRRDGRYPRDRFRGSYGYSPYGYPPYAYANSTWLVPWDLGYPDFTGYGDNGGYSDSAGQQAGAASSADPPQEENSSRPDYDPRPAYGYPAAYPDMRSRVPATALTPEPALTLIYKDGHTQEIHNYALTPSKVLLLDDAASGREMQVPLGDLDVPATERAAQKAGLEFHPPA